MGVALCLDNLCLNLRGPMTFALKDGGLTHDILGMDGAIELIGSHLWLSY